MDLNQVSDGQVELDISSSSPSSLLWFDIFVGELLMLQRLPR